MRSLTELQGSIDSSFTMISAPHPSVTRRSLHMGVPPISSVMSSAIFFLSMTPWRATATRDVRAGATSAFTEAAPSANARSTFIVRSVNQPRSRREEKQVVGRRQRLTSRGRFR